MLNALAARKPVAPGVARKRGRKKLHQDAIGISLDTLPPGCVALMGGVVPWCVVLTVTSCVDDPLLCSYQAGDIFTGDISELLQAAKQQQRGESVSHTGGTHTADDATVVEAAVSLDSSTVSTVGGIAASLAETAEAHGVQPPQEALMESPAPALSTSPLPGTTLGVVQTSIDGTEAVVLDTPGIIVNTEAHHLWERLGAEYGTSGLSRVRPSQTIKVGSVRGAWHNRAHVHFFVGLCQPLIHRLCPGRSMFISGLARVDFHHPDPEACILATWFGKVQPHLTSTTRTHAPGLRCG